MCRLARAAIAASLVMGCAASQSPARAPAEPGVAPARPAPPAAPASSADPAELPDWVTRAIADVRLPSADNARELAASEHVVVTRTHVIAFGTAVATVDEIAKQGRLGRVEALFVAMKQARERFKSEHPDRPFPGTVTLWIDAATPALVVKNVFQTCAFAGYPNGAFGVRRRSDARFAKLEAAAQVPGPPALIPPGASLPSKVTGRLPPEVIQRIVRQNYGLFQQCYERALLKDPKLEGRVVVRFVIAADGSITDVRDEGSTLASPEAVSCMLEIYRKLRFPAPEGGIVTVVYPIQFAPE